MSPLFRKYMIRLPLFIALSIIAVMTDIHDVIAQGGADAAVTERVHFAASGKHAAANGDMRVQDYDLPGLSVRSQEVSIPKVSILEVKDLPGQKAAVRGTVVTEPTVWKSRGGKLSVHIQDDTGGIHVLMPPRAAVKKGDLVQITGTIADYEGLIEMRAADQGIQVLDTGRQAPEPTAFNIEDLQKAHKALPFLGRLVKVKAQIGQIPEKPQGGAYRIPLLVGDGAVFTLYVREGDIDPRQLRDKAWYEITGILTRYDGYRIIPCGLNDLRLLSPQS